MKLTVVHTRVFCFGPGGGNPAPIVFEADALSADGMRALAANFGFETGFVLAPSRPEFDVRLRYFVPRHEMEMCVHATVGAVTVLGAFGRLERSPLNVETSLGPIRVHWKRRAGHLEVLVEQFPPVFHPDSPTAAELADLLGIPETAIDLALGPIQSVSTSRPKLIIPLRDSSALDALRPDFDALSSLCDTYRTSGCYPFTMRPRRSDLRAEARQFPLRAGYPEDPATGVAACALGAYLTEHGIAAEKEDGWHSFRIGQGFAMGRPSMLTSQCLVEQARIVRTRVAGEAMVESKEFVELDL